MVYKEHTNNLLKQERIGLLVCSKGYIEKRNLGISKENIYFALKHEKI